MGDRELNILADKMVQAMKRDPHICIHQTEWGEVKTTLIYINEFIKDYKNQKQGLSTAQVIGFCTVISTLITGIFTILQKII